MEDVHLAIGATAAAVAVSAVMNLILHARSHTVRWPRTVVFALFGVAGAAGSTLDKLTQPELLLSLFGALMLVAVAIAAPTGLLLTSKHQKGAHGGWLDILGQWRGHRPWALSLLALWSRGPAPIPRPDYWHCCGITVPSVFWLSRDSW